MKANELMIGDWVYNSYHKKNIKWDYSEMFCPNGIPVIGRDIEPIPLTPEILEKNGWMCSDGWFERNGVNFFISKCGNKYKLCQVFHIRSFVTITYVHELQHALRLCGLNDLADNFKV